MTKQEFMDKAKKNTAEQQILMLMLGMSKTQLLTALRHLKMINKVLYTTEMKQTTLDALLKGVEIAWEYMENGKIENDEPNKVDNNK